MKAIPVYQCDAFTDTMFGGNPAAVCPLKEWLPAPLMQKIAAENNLAETAFFISLGPDLFELRWFTPNIEVDLCGHATLAVAHIIFTELNYAHETIHFHTLKAGTLTVTKQNNLYILNFPSRVASEVEMPGDLIDALGGSIPKQVYKSRDYMVVYDTEEQILALKPDFLSLSKIDALGIIVTARGNNCDFVSRFFAPSAGINEDPVTGSAHCTLIPYWAKELNKLKLLAYQLSERRGQLWCELQNDRVLIAGNVITYLKGEIYL